MKGLPASGKSTHSKELIEKNGNTVRLNKDLIRTMLHFDKFTRYNEELTQDASKVLAKYFLENNVNVIIDDTNLNPKVLQSWKDMAKSMSIAYEVVKFDLISVNTCVLRDSIREKNVGAHVIKKMALQYLDYMKDTKVVISDLDGTLCDLTHRLQYAKGETKDWNKFFSLIKDDVLRKEVWDEVKSYNLPIILVSARPETYRKETKDWLYINDIHYDLLIMRDANDKREDTLVKSDIYDKYLKNLDIQALFDDRPSVIRMWKEKGLNVIDVGQGIEF